jgi:hypothetical protein
MVVHENRQITEVKKIKEMMAGDAGIHISKHSLTDFDQFDPLALCRYTRMAYWDAEVG